ncbi:MAG: heme exporter protein CcmB [Fimbriimonadaceae bacterium]|nr:heme exporter protein CcmB [Fimbriimonadaceae bacterium]
MAQPSSGWAAEAAAVLRKDLRVELRTRYALTAVGQFAVTCLVAVSFTAGPQAQSAVQAALLWLVLLFAALSGLARSFVAEEDGRTGETLRLAAGATAVYLGKCAFNVLLLLALCGVLVPGYQVLMDVVWRDPALLLATLLTGSIGLAAVLTFTSALVARAQMRGAVGAVVAFPLLIPLLVMAVAATTAALDGSLQGWYHVRGLAAFAGIMLTVALLLFEVVWNA